MLFLRSQKDDESPTNSKGKKSLSQRNNQNEKTNTTDNPTLVDSESQIYPSPDFIDHSPNRFVNPRHKFVSSWEPSRVKIVDWRIRERMRTSHVALVMCLNIGVDPPDIVKTDPCARLECWFDPLSLPASKALTTVGNALQAQYKRWEPTAKYKQNLDPTIEDIERRCLNSRRDAGVDHILFHYNGHGVPRPTGNGEIWVFNKEYTQYIPLALRDLQRWIGAPSIFVFDCSAAALLVREFMDFQRRREQEIKREWNVPMAEQKREIQRRECILLCACRENETLPQNPNYPADVFTACLTTPIKVALRWVAQRSRLKNVSPELIDKIPGKPNSRQTVLGELNWIFTAVTDSIAWNVLPSELFQKLYRQDRLVSSLFRNFLLADRVLRSLDCTPISYPKLPPTHNHPMWEAWDLAAEYVLCQLDRCYNEESNQHSVPSILSIPKKISVADVKLSEPEQTNVSDSLYMYIQDITLASNTNEHRDEERELMEDIKSSTNDLIDQKKMLEKLQQTVRDLEGKVDKLHTQHVTLKRDKQTNHLMNAEQRHISRHQLAGGQAHSHNHHHQIQSSTNAQHHHQQIHSSSSAVVAGAGGGPLPISSVEVRKRTERDASRRKKEEVLKQNRATDRKRRLNNAERKINQFKKIEEETRRLRELEEKKVQKVIGEQKNESLKGTDNGFVWQQSKFFEEQLTAFEVWLQFGSEKKKPVQLPVVLQVLMSKNHRLRAFKLLARFLDKGSWAVNLALSVGIVPYALRLLKRYTPDLGEFMVFIWSKILSVDRSCQTDLINEIKEEDEITKYYPYFVSHLCTPGLTHHQRIMSAFVISSIADNFRNGQLAMLSCKPLDVIKRFFSSSNHLVRRWMALAIAKLIQNCEEGKLAVHDKRIQEDLIALTRDDIPEVRAGAIYAIGKFFSTKPFYGYVELDVARKIGRVIADGSGMVRRELAMALADLIYNDKNAFAMLNARRKARKMTRSSLTPSAFPSPTMVPLPSPMMSRNASQQQQLNTPSATSPQINSPTTNSNHQQQQNTSHLSPPSTDSPRRNNSDLSPSMLPSGSGGEQSAESNENNILNSPESDKSNSSQSSAEDADLPNLERKSAGVDDIPPLEKEMSDEDSNRSYVWKMLNHLTRDPMPCVADIALTVRRYCVAFERKSASLTSSKENLLIHSRSHPQLSATEKRERANSSNSHHVSYSSIHNTAPGGGGGSRVDPKYYYAGDSSSRHSRSGRQGGAFNQPSPSRRTRNGSLDHRSRHQHHHKQLHSQHHQQYYQQDETTHPSQHFTNFSLSGQRSSIPQSSPALPRAKPRKKTNSREKKHITGEEKDIRLRELELQVPTSSFYIWSCAYFNEPLLSSERHFEERKGEEEHSSQNNGPQRSVNNGILIDAAPVHSQMSSSSQMSSHVHFSNGINFGHRRTLLNNNININIHSPRWDVTKDLNQADIRHDSELPLQQRRWYQHRQLDLKAGRLRDRYVPHKIDDQVAVFETDSDSTSKVLFHSYENLIIAADNRNRISVFNFETRGEDSNTFSNQNQHGSKITDLKIVNEDSDFMLLVASDDGNVRIWKNPCESGREKLVSAFVALPRMNHTRQPGVIVEWQQRTGRMILSGATNEIRLWDAEKARCVQKIDPRTEKYVTDMHTAEDDENILYTGCGDGTIRIFDVRQKHPMIACESLHEEFVVRVFLKEGRLISAGIRGGLCFTDIRKLDGGNLSVQPGPKIKIHKNNPLNALAVHEYAPVIASASCKQFVRIVNLDGEEIHTIRYYDGFLGQRIGPVSSLAFHRHKLLLAVAGWDSYVSVYAGNPILAPGLDVDALF